jgi:hypothetical protein
MIAGQLDLFASSPQIGKEKAPAPEPEKRWIRHPGRICTEATCPHYKLDHSPWGSCDEESYLIISGPWLGDECMATYFPGEGPRPAESGVKEHCQTCASFAGCDWWQWAKPCRNYIGA